MVEHYYGHIDTFIDTRNALEGSGYKPTRFSGITKENGNIVFGFARKIVEDKFPRFHIRIELADSQYRLSLHCDIKEHSTDISTETLTLRNLEIARIINLLKQNIHNNQSQVLELKLNEELLFGLANQVHNISITNDRDFLDRDLSNRRNNKRLHGILKHKAKAILLKKKVPEFSSSEIF